MVCTIRSRNSVMCVYVCVSQFAEVFSTLPIVLNEIKVSLYNIRAAGKNNERNEEKPEKKAV